MKTKLVTGILLFFASFSGYAEEQKIKGIVTEIIDGNTIELSTDDHETYKVLLHGIDCPDPGQNYAEQAKRRLGKLLLNKAVTITLHGNDRRGNRLGEIHIDGSPDPSMNY